MFPKAIASGADMVCIELEDGIAIKDKDEARKNTIEALKTLEVKSGVELVVRVNCQRTKFGLLDLEAFISSKLKVKAIMLPKVKNPVSWENGYNEDEVGKEFFDNFIRENKINEKLIDALFQIHGGYSLVIMTNKKMIGIQKIHHLFLFHL